MPVHFPYIWDGVYVRLLLQDKITLMACRYVALIQVAIAQGFHLFPFRTEKLSSLTPMVLRLSRGRVGSRLFKVRSKDLTFFVVVTSCVWFCGCGGLRLLTLKRRRAANRIDNHPKPLLERRGLFIAARVEGKRLRLIRRSYGAL